MLNLIFIGEFLCKIILTALLPSSFQLLIKILNFLILNSN